MYNLYLLLFEAILLLENFRIINFYTFLYIFKLNIPLDAYILFITLILFLFTIIFSKNQIYYISLVSTLIIGA